MIYVILSIICSVTVAILLKLARRYSIDVMQAVTWNYTVCIALCAFFYKPGLDVPAAPPLAIYASLGLLLPTLFLVIAASIRYTGIVRTDVAQRLSLFIPIVAATLLFGEVLPTQRIIGVCVGFTAIFCSIQWQKSTGSDTRGKAEWVYPLTVFIGMGVIDILFKQIAAYKEIPYTTSLFYVFIFAFVIALLILSYRLIIKKSRFEWVNMLCGIILGLFNFGNILFYLKAHRELADSPSVVFTAMNTGVIILGSLVGLFAFKEKLSPLNYLGLVLALASILIIAFS